MRRSSMARWAAKGLWLEIFHALEQFFAKLRALLRKAAARTKEALWRTAGQLLDLVSPAECQSYLTNAGYELT